MYILNFHGLGSPSRSLTVGEKQCWLDPSFFGAILDLIRTRDDVGVTFDDSNESDHAIALPELTDRGIFAKFFLVAERIDQGGYLSKRQIESLVAAGMSIGCHGMCHRRWTSLNDRELHEELVEARDRLEQISGTHVTEAACPFGSYNRRALRALENAGYKAIYTSDNGPALANTWIQPRNTVLRSHSLPAIQEMINDVPRGFAQILRDLKLKAKQWR